MAIQMVLFDSEQPFQVGSPYLIGAATVLLALLWHLVQDERPYPGFPLINKQKGEWLNTKAKERMITHANEILKDGYKRVSACIFP